VLSLSLSLCWPIGQVPNLQVVKLMQSLKSRNFVKERYNWRYLYFFLTNEARRTPCTAHDPENDAPRALPTNAIPPLRQPLI
jgi:small subunit ribosomal protein S10e